MYTFLTVVIEYHSVRLRGGLGGGGGGRRSDLALSVINRIYCIVYRH